MTSPLPMRLVVRFGGGLRIVSCLADAKQIIDEWPKADRGIVHGFAARVLETAMAGRATEKDVFAALEALCERSGLLVRR